MLHLLPLACVFAYLIVMLITLVRIYSVGFVEIKEANSIILIMEIFIGLFAVGYVGKKLYDTIK